MERIVECVPNFSEGHDRSVIDAIARSISSVPDVVLLDVDPGEATNRTVVTFVGSPEGVQEAAFQAIQTAADLIDMREHLGAHARMGATDVCPFVPVRGVTMDDCVKIAREVGARVAEELGIPVYLYEHAAVTPERRNLASIRKGEYEGLEDKLKDPHWIPDFGEARFNPKSGATVIGAREFLIAYNVNLNTKDRRIAHDIALDIREAGRAKRDEKGKIIRDQDGKVIKVSGLLKACKAVGWVIDEYQKAQVSINLTDYKITPPHVAFESVREGARKRGLRVTGSEIVGLIPLEAMLLAGKYYLEKQGKTTAVPEAELVRVAVESLGLNDVATFNPEEKIVDYCVRKKGELMSLSIHHFANELSTSSPAPGGGSVAALMGSLSGALVSMVAALTHSKAMADEARQKMEVLGTRGQELKDRLGALVDDDAKAFREVMAALRMKRKSEEDKRIREKAIQEAMRAAIEVPLKVATLCVELLETAEVVAEEGIPNAVSDAGVAAEAAYAGLLGARLNVLVNLAGVEDNMFRERMTREVDTLRAKGKSLRARIEESVERIIREKRE